ncbi:hypothetical protein Drorol1_Dr00008192 [Drosera rotundifolia]
MSNLRNQLTFSTVESKSSGGVSLKPPRFDLHIVVRRRRNRAAMSATQSEATEAETVVAVAAAMAEER